MVYGDWVRVFLVTEAIDIPGLDLTGAEALVERASRINSAHMTFFNRMIRGTSAHGCASAASPMCGGGLSPGGRSRGVGVMGRRQGAAARKYGLPLRVLGAGRPYCCGASSILQRH